MTISRTNFHLMAKPSGPICNLGCEYCFYLEKEAQFPRGAAFRMSDAVLEEYIQQSIASSPGPDVSFAWQGGEPTLLGVKFFRQAVALQKRHLPPGWSATNAMQTNGTLLDEEWCQFFRDERFLVGISLDGPPHLHDIYRVDKANRPTHEGVMRGLHLLRSYGVEYNILCVVNSQNAAAPLEVYRYFKEAGAAWIQFIPLVEPVGGERVTERSVSAEAYGRFLVAVFDEWVRNDVGRIFVQTFEESARVWLGMKAGLCIFAQTCGRNPVIEHDGTVYACDHFVTPEFRLGNIQESALPDLVGSPIQSAFADAKRDSLPAQCRSCEVRFICNGGCPKDRIIRTPDGEPGLNYLCDGYKRFFTHAGPHLGRIAWRIQRGLPAEGIMAELRQADAARWAAVRRNDPCPCGSGKKYKACCLSSHRGE